MPCPRYAGIFIDAKDCSNLSDFQVRRVSTVYHKQCLCKVGRIDSVMVCGNYDLAASYAQFVKVIFNQVLEKIVDVVVRCRASVDAADFRVEELIALLRRE
jgi:hypothetical protein